jgi:UDP-N-acetylmuramoyl-tripeptide--D-alanyl-D-alanine ligase
MASRTTARVVRIGQDISAADLVLDDQVRASFRMVTPHGEAPVALALHGAHHVGNALAVAAVALELGATVEEVAGRLCAARRRSARRMDVTTRSDGVTVINDSFNANPESMAAALRGLAAMAATGRRSWAVLGMMGELGEAHAAAHEDIGRLAMRLGVDRLVVVDELASPMLASAKGELVPDVDAAVALLRSELRSGDIVLVKASKVVGIWRVADALLEEAGGVA